MDILTNEEIKETLKDIQHPLDDLYLLCCQAVAQAQSLKCQQAYDQEVEALTIASVEDAQAKLETIWGLKQAIQEAKKEGFILGRTIQIPVDLLNESEIEELNKQANAFCDGLKKEGMRELMEWERQLCTRKNHSAFGDEHSFCTICQTAKLKELE